MLTFTNPKVEIKGLVSWLPICREVLNIAYIYHVIDATIACLETCRCLDIDTINNWHLQIQCPMHCNIY